MLTDAALVLRLITTSHLALLLALLLRDHRSDRSGRAAAGFIASIIGYLALPVGLHFGASPLWLTPVLVSAFIVPLAFWLLAKEHFDDGATLGYTVWLGAASLIASSTASFVTGPLTPVFAAELRSLPQHLFWMSVSKVLGGAFVLHALYRVLVGAKADLVELRLKLRYVFLVVSGVYVLIVIVGEATFHNSELERTADTINSAIILGLVIGFSFLFTGTGAQFLREMQPAREPASPELVLRLKEAIETEHVYREQGLTIAKLSKRLGEYEHKLRQHINSDLGFRNFNAFVHHFRIRDACDALKDSRQDGRSIAEIAFELGYQSLGPFNKAFKETTGQTPSDFRKTRR